MCGDRPLRETAQVEVLQFEGVVIVVDAGGSCHRVTASVDERDDDLIFTLCGSVHVDVAINVLGDLTVDRTEVSVQGTLSHAKRRGRAGSLVEVRSRDRPVVVRQVVSVGLVDDTEAVRAGQTEDVGALSTLAGKHVVLLFEGVVGVDVDAAFDELPVAVVTDVDRNLVGSGCGAGDVSFSADDVRVARAVNRDFALADVDRDVVSGVRVIGDVTAGDIGVVDLDIDRGIVEILGFDLTDGHRPIHLDFSVREVDVLGVSRVFASVLAVRSNRVRVFDVPEDVFGVVRTDAVTEVGTVDDDVVGVLVTATGDSVIDVVTANSTVATEFEAELRFGGELDRRGCDCVVEVLRSFDRDGVIAGIRVGEIHHDRFFVRDRRATFEDLVRDVNVLLFDGDLSVFGVLEVVVGDDLQRTGVFGRHARAGDVGLTIAENFDFVHVRGDDRHFVTGAVRVHTGFLVVIDRKLKLLPFRTAVRCAGQRIAGEVLGELDVIFALIDRVTRVDGRVVGVTRRIAVGTVAVVGTVATVIGIALNDSDRVLTEGCLRVRDENSVNRVLVTDFGSRRNGYLVRNRRLIR